MGRPSWTPSCLEEEGLPPAMPPFMATWHRTGTDLLCKPRAEQRLAALGWAGLCWRPLLPLGEEAPAATCKGRGATSHRHTAPHQPQQHRAPPRPVPTSLFSRDWSSSDTFRKTSSSVVSISPKLVRSSSSRLCSKCCGGKILHEEGRRCPQHHGPHARLPAHPTSPRGYLKEPLKTAFLDGLTGQDVGELSVGI